jgi:hypothetical protein
VEKFQPDDFPQGLETIFGGKIIGVESKTGEIGGSE